MLAYPFSHHAVGHVSFAASQQDASVGITLVVAIAGAGIGLVVVCLFALLRRRVRRPLGVANVGVPRRPPSQPPLVVAGVAGNEAPPDPPCAVGAWHKGSTEVLPVPLPPPTARNRVAPTLPMSTMAPARTLKTPVPPSASQSSGPHAGELEARAPLGRELGKAIEGGEPVV